MKIRPILASYIPMAQMLVKTLGEDCEVVLHDLLDPEHSVVYVANNSVTGRKEGQSFDELIKQVILSKELKDDFVANYYFKADNGKLIRSSSLLIRAANGALEGALCLNLDTTKITAQLTFLQSLLPQNNSHSLVHNNTSAVDNQTDDNQVTQMITSLIDNILADCQPHTLSREGKLQKIKFMDNKGIFLMKGSIEQVAEKMGISRVTVYSYLDAIKKQSE